MKQMPTLFTNQHLCDDPPGSAGQANASRKSSRFQKSGIALTCLCSRDEAGVLAIALRLGERPFRWMANETFGVKMEKQFF
jgi:hypothetical protein